MKKWKFTGTDERVFLFPRAFSVQPGEVVEAEHNPDPDYFVGADTKAAAELEEKN